MDGDPAALSCHVTVHLGTVLQGPRLRRHTWFGEQAPRLIFCVRKMGPRDQQGVFPSRDTETHTWETVKPCVLFQEPKSIGAPRGGAALGAGQERLLTLSGPGRPAWGSPAPASRRWAGGCGMCSDPALSDAQGCLQGAEGTRRLKQSAAVQEGLTEEQVLKTE